MALRFLIAFFLLAARLELPGCGFVPEALFTLKLHPENDTEFSRGKLGILQPTYMRFYLVVAYRYLSGVGLNDEERAALFPPQHPPAPYVAPGTAWLEARNAVPGVSRMNAIDTYRHGFDPKSYDYFQNCNEEAFRTAAATLEDRMRRFGASSPLITDWVAAQDTVFADCRSATPVFPPPAADARLRADRAYQIAAAKFYAGQYDAAHSDFEQIAADSDSAWQGIATYLEARCSIRKRDLPRAAEELRAVMADPRRSQWHEPARRLLEYVRTQMDPGSRIRELGAILAHPDIQDHIAADLNDYRLLLDKVSEPPLEDDLTDWIASYQGGSRDHVLERWRQKRSLPWLLAALERVNAGDSEAGELLAAARTVEPESPAYIDATWQALRLMPAAEARATIDEVLDADIPVAARNQFRGRRMEQARSFREFLQFAPRTIVGEQVDAEIPGVQTEEYLDHDAQAILNRMPLDLLREASAGTLLPAKVRQQLEGVVWVRSVLLRPSPSFDEVYRLLRSPGLHFEVDFGPGRIAEKETEIDSLRNNWWCAVKTSPEPASQQPAPQLPAPQWPSFLTAPQVAQAKREWERLSAVATGPDWLAAQALSWAEKAPNDPRIPEALHLAVRATRYGCTDKETGALSRRAFELLHSRYGNTEWAAQTKYWFK